MCIYGKNYCFFVRVDLSHQKLELLEFARNKAMNIDALIEISISSRKTSKDELMNSYKPLMMQE